MCFHPNMFELLVPKDGKCVSVQMWLNSTSHMRWPFVRIVVSLQKHLQVDVYGKCGPLSCDDCHLMLHRHYKFYLAFENSLCKDYVTEKLFKTTQSVHVFFDVFFTEIFFKTTKSVDVFFLQKYFSILKSQLMYFLNVFTEIFFETKKLVHVPSRD